MRLPTLPKASGAAALVRSQALALALAACAPSWALDLGEAIAAATAHDPALRASSLSREADRLGRDAAESKLWPQVYLQGSSSATGQTTTQDTFFGPSTTTFSGPSGSHQLSLRQGLLRPRDLIGVDVAELQAMRGELRYQADQADLWSRTASAWLEAAAVGQQLRLLDGALLATAGALAQERARYARGESTREAVAEALAQHESLGAARADKRLGLQAQRRAFALLTGLPEDVLDGVALRPEPPAPLQRLGDSAAVGELVEQALERAAARLDVELGAKRLRQAEVDHYPTLDLTASIASARNDATSTQGYSYLNRQVGLQYTVPIYTGGGLTAAKGQASRAYEASQAQSQAVANRLESQLWSLAAAEAGALERCRADELVVAAAREQLNFAARAYAQGLQTKGDLANAEAVLARRSVDRVQNLLGVYRTQLGLLKSLPTGHPLWQRWLAGL